MLAFDGNINDFTFFSQESRELTLGKGVIVAKNFIVPWNEEVVIFQITKGDFPPERFYNEFQILPLPEIPNRDDQVSAWCGNSKEFIDGFFADLFRWNVMEGCDAKRGVD